jgi:hypothetical protein
MREKIFSKNGEKRLNKTAFPHLNNRGNFFEVAKNG